MSYDGTQAATLAHYDEVLKTFYLPAIQDQLNRDNPLSDLIDVNEEDVSGKDATIECHYGRNKGGGSRKDGGALPEADYQKFKTMKVPMKYDYHRITLTGPTIAATRTEKGSYARAMDVEVRGAVDDMQSEVNRMLWGVGYGILARWNSGTGTTMYLQKLYRGNSDGVDAFGSTFGAKYFDEVSAGVGVTLTTGTEITVATVGGTDMVIGTITDYADNDTIVVTTEPATPAAGTYFVRPGSSETMNESGGTAGAGRYEMMGLRGIVTNTDLDDIIFLDGSLTGMASMNDPLQGLNVSDNPWWRALVNASSGGRYSAQRALTINNMQKQFDDVEEKAGKDYGPDAVFTTRAMRREYLDLCQADRRAVNTMTLDKGWKALDYNGIPLMVDNDAIDGEIYFLTLKDLQLYRMSDYDWMAKDGAVLSRISGRDAYEAVLFRYAELGCKRRNSQGVLVDLSYDL